jgi:hypothetical protein
MSYLAGSTSQLIKTGTGTFTSLVISSHTSGTITLRDGTENSATATKGTGVLTIAGAITYGEHASSVLTSDGTTMSAGDIITLDTTVYTCANAITGGSGEEYKFKKGTTAAETFENLYRCMLGVSGAGTVFGTGTLPHPTVHASELSSTTIKCVARDTGTSYNSIVTTETSTHASWEDTTLGGGTGLSNTGVTPETFVIRGKTYELVDILSETFGLPSKENQIKDGTSVALTLVNALNAVNNNLSGGYSTATKAHLLVTATSSTATRLNIQAITAGVETEATTLTETMTNGAWDYAQLNGGAGVSTTVIDTYTPASGFVGRIDIPSFPFTSGLYLAIGGTIKYTLFYE